MLPMRASLAWASCCRRSWYSVRCRSMTTPPTASPVSESTSINLLVDRDICLVPCQQLHREDDVGTGLLGTNETHFGQCYPGTTLGRLQPRSKGVRQFRKTFAR